MHKYHVSGLARHRSESTCMCLKSTSISVSWVSELAKCSSLLLVGVGVVSDLTKVEQTNAVPAATTVLIPAKASDGPRACLQQGDRRIELVLAGNTGLVPSEACITSLISQLFLL